MAADDPNRDPRVYMAAERTFLAWIRTSLALMAFGFVLARFGLFLRVVESSSGGRISEPSTLSLPLGVFLVLLGVIVDIFPRGGTCVRARDRPRLAEYGAALDACDGSRCDPCGAELMAIVNDYAVRGAETFQQLGGPSLRATVGLLGCWLGGCGSY